VTLGEVLAPGAGVPVHVRPGDNWRHHCLLADDNVDLVAQLGIVPDRPLPYWGWGLIPDPYGRLFETDDSQAPIPDSPHQPWPWANAPEPAIATLHCPGQYTRTVDLAARTPDDPDDYLDGPGWRWDLTCATPTGRGTGDEIPAGAPTGLGPRGRLRVSLYAGGQRAR
jgi:hypothetical protein